MKTHFLPAGLEQSSKSLDVHGKQKDASAHKTRLVQDVVQMVVLSLAQACIALKRAGQQLHAGQDVCGSQGFQQLRCIVLQPTMP